MKRQLFFTILIVYSFILIQSKRAKFFATYQPQDFSLPDSVMFYLATNPPSPKLYKKMIQTCKYFFLKNQILVIPEFSYFANGKWELSLGSRPIYLSKITSKLWIIDGLFFHHGNSDNILTSAMPKIFQCDAKYIYLRNQIISFHDLSLLISSAKYITFDNITVKHENGTNVVLEKIVEVSLKARRIRIFSNTTLSNITSQTMKELIKLPHFSKLGELQLHCIPEAFDLDTFCAYMKNNKTTKFLLYFDDSISEVYKNRLEELVDGIFATETHVYKPPLMDFDGLDEEKYNKLLNVFLSY